VYSNVPINVCSKTLLFITQVHNSETIRSLTNLAKHLNYRTSIVVYTHVIGEHILITFWGGRNGLHYPK